MADDRLEPGMPRLARKATIVVGIAAAGFVAFAGWRLTMTPAHSIPADGIALAIFSALACATSASTARKWTGSRRRTWGALAIGLAGWTVGNLVWLYYEMILAIDCPFPSIADIGFLLLPISVAFASLTEVAANGLSALRPLLDGVLIAAAVFILSWVLVLEETFRSTDLAPFTDTAKIAYPMSDVVIVTVTLLALMSMPAPDRLAGAIVTTGLIIIAVADSTWIYLQPHAGSPPAAAALGWLVGLLTITLGALWPDPPQTPHRPEPGRPLGALFWLPYLPLSLAVIAGMSLLWQVPRARPILVATVVLIVSALGRQLVVLLDNRRLLVIVAEQARRDPLTGLGNRLLFNDRLDTAIRSRAADGSPVAVLALDLDDFKMVNDNLGHPVGDELLIEVAHRLTDSVPAGQAVARLGGDEFAILIQAAPRPVSQIAQDVLEAFDVPFVLEGEEIFIHPSVGLAIADDDTADDDDDDGRDISAEDLLQRADVALYAAKRTGIGGVQTFSSSLQQDSALALPERWSDSGRVRLNANAGLQLLGPLRRAITNGELQLIYQPKVSLRTGNIAGVEALIRWPHPRLGLLPPRRFLPLIRRNGLIGAVTDLVLNQAARDAATWYREGTRQVPVSINLFAPSLSDIALADRIGSVLSDHELPPGAMQIEITEHLLLGNLSRTHTVITSLRESGLKVSIDDFGSGYSTMSYLRDLPIDELKLDRMFVAPILHNPRAAAIVRAVIDLTKALDIVSVAEGVEDLLTAEQLAADGCDEAQGFYFAKPMPSADLRLLLDTGTSMWPKPADRH